MLTCSLVAGWTDERLEDWAKLMDRNVSQRDSSRSLPLLIMVSVTTCSPERSRFWVDMRTLGCRTISRHRTQIATMRRTVDADEEGQEADLVGALATRVIEADAAVAGAGMVGVEAEGRTNRAAVIQMLRGREDTTRRCRRLPDGHDEPHLVGEGYTYFIASQASRLLDKFIGLSFCHLFHATISFWQNLRL